MLFNSYEFIFLFLPFTFFIYFYLNKKRLTKAGKVWLLFSSLFFYSWWDISYLPIILGSIIVNYIVGRSLYQILDGKRRKRITRKLILVFGIVFNLYLLSFNQFLYFIIKLIHLFLSLTVQCSRLK